MESNTLGKAATLDELLNTCIKMFGTHLKYIFNSSKYFPLNLPNAVY